ncbi:MAG: transporter substrate-binding domain-containing protein [Alphaproteobacteria bacterium]|nr:transporter substrate-binding domain-containing protein [Alphaproteobacteria bacterium]
MRNLIVTILLSAAIASGIGYSLGSKTSPSQVTTSDTAYDRIIKSGKIRCGYTLVAPSLTRDPNTGAFSGVSYEIMEKLGQDLGLVIEWAEETSFASMSEGLKTNRFDMVCTVVWSGTARGKASQFSRPLFYSAINAYGRTDDDRLASLPSFNSPDLTIAMIDGSTAAQIARDDTPQAKSYSLPDMTDFSQLMVAVTDKKADLTFSEEAQANVYLAKNPNSVKNLTPEKPVRLFANRFSMKMGEANLVAMIDNGIENLQNAGFIDAVLDKYAPLHAYHRVAKPYR